MARLLLLLFLAWLVWRGIDSVLAQLRDPGGARPPLRNPGPRPAGPQPAGPQPAGPQVIETLVPCAGCGTHVLRSRTVTGPGGAFYCSEDCQRRAAQSA